MWGASRDGSEGCSCKTALFCQCLAAVEEGNLEQAKLHIWVYPTIGTELSRSPGPPPGCQGTCLGSPPPGEGEGIGVARAPHIQPHLRLALSIKPGSQMQTLAVQAFLSAFQQLQPKPFPHGHPPWQCCWHSFSLAGRCKARAVGTRCTWTFLPKKQPTKPCSDSVQPGWSGSPVSYQEHPWVCAHEGIEVAVCCCFLLSPLGQVCV